MLKLSKCAYCVYETYDDDLSTHIVKHHSSHPDFCAVCSHCSRTWKKYSAKIKHIQREHNIVHTPNLNNELSDELLYEDILFDDKNNLNLFPGETLVSAENALCKFSALYLLHLKPKHGLSQTAIDDIVSGTKHVISSSCTLLHQKLSSMPQTINSVYNVDFFAETSIGWNQQKYFKECLGLIESVEVIMGKSTM